MTNNDILAKITDYVKAIMLKDTTGHDWWHVFRVNRLACYIAKKEKADEFIVSVASLLHDLTDWKLCDDNTEKQSQVVREWLLAISIKEPVVNHICEIMDNVSFKGANVDDYQLSLEGQIVRDADRLDAMGAIGIARAFTYGGHKKLPIHEPGRSPVYHNSFESYKNNVGTTVNHFYEKLLMLKDRMHTKTGKRLAIERHRYMEEFLEVFYLEWNTAVE